MTQAQTKRKAENRRVAQWKEWNRQQTRINNAIIQRNSYLEVELKKYQELIDYILDFTTEKEFYGDVAKLKDLALAVNYEG